MTFLGEIVKLYLQQGNFLDNLMPTLNKEKKNKASMLKIDVSYYFHSSPTGVFRDLHLRWIFFFLRKWLKILSQLIFLQKVLSQMPMFVVTEFLHGFNKTV